MLSYLQAPHTLMFSATKCTLVVLQRSTMFVSGVGPVGTQPSGRTTCLQLLTLVPFSEAAEKSLVTKTQQLGVI